MTTTNNQGSIFEMFASVVPESMKVTAPPVPAKSSKGTSKSSVSKPSTPYKPKEPEVVLVPLPVTVYYARERRTLTADDFLESEITYKVVKKAEDKPNITVKKEGDESVAPSASEVEKTVIESSCEEDCCDDQAENEREDVVKKNFRSAASAGDIKARVDVPDLNDDIDLDIEFTEGEDSEDEDTKKPDEAISAEEPKPSEEKYEIDDIPKVTLETIRQKLVWDWPELTKERTRMDYDKEAHMVIPIVYSGAKGNR